MRQCSIESSNKNVDKLDARKLMNFDKNFT